MPMSMLALVLAAAAVAQPSLTRVGHDAEERGRAEVADLLKSLCPEQCILLSVQARVEAQELPSDPTPGFDAAASPVVPELRSVEASVLVDARLPAPFRARVKALVAQRLLALGVPSKVSLEQVSFPQKNPAYLEPPPPKPPEAKPPDVPKPEIAAATPAALKLDERLLEHAPLLAVVAMLGLTLVLLGGLFFLAARPRPQPEPAWDFGPASPESEQPEAPAAEGFPAARLRKLEKQLVDERALRNAIVREALGRGEHALVARWVRELGEFLLEDVRGDGALAAALGGVAAEVVKPVDAGARTASLQELEGRAIAARLARAGEDDAFAFLEGVRPEAFAAASAGLSAGARELALRFAPAHLRSAALRDLEPAARQEIALAWARKPQVSTSYALAAADELRARLSQLSGAPPADRALSDLLDTLPRSEQDALIERLRRDGSNVAGLLTESALSSAPAEAITSAALRMAPEKLLACLAGTDALVLDAVLSALPQKLVAELKEELSLGSRGSGDFFAARRELLARLREELEKRGIGAPGLPARPRLATVE